MKKYKVRCKTENPSFIPSTNVWKQRLIHNEIYEVFAMKGGFNIVIEGNFVNELDNVKRCRITHHKGFCKANFEYV